MRAFERRMSGLPTLLATAVVCALDLSDASGLLLTQLQQTGVVAQNNFVTTQKALDNDYMEGKRIISLPQALGAREVQAAQSPGGPAPRQV